MPSAPLVSLDLLSSQAPGEPLGTVVIPTRDHMNAYTVQSITNTDWRFCGSKNSMDFHYVIGSVLPLQRNEAIQRMRGHFLLFIDDDMVFGSDAIGQLVETFFELDEKLAEPIVVGGLCFRRSEPYQPTLYMRERPNDGPYNILEKWEDDVVEVDATGCAFLLIPVTAIEAIIGGPMPPYEFRAEERTPPNIFQWSGKFGEDLRFCQDFKAAGGRIFVDTRIKVGHISEVQIGHKNFLQSVALRSEETENQRILVNSAMNLPTLTRAEAKELLGWT